MMIEFVPIATDVVAITILAYALYFRRYYSRHSSDRYICTQSMFKHLIGKAAVMESSYA